MSEHSAAPSGSASASGRGRRNVFARMFGAVALFVRQVLDELRKVVRPTREELTTYTIVVIVFVAAVMLLVFGLDTAFQALVALVFGQST